MLIVEKLREQMEEKEILDVPIVLGGVIPEKDMPRLKELGVKGIFTSGSSIDMIAKFVIDCARERQEMRGR